MTIAKIDKRLDRNIWISNSYAAKSQVLQYPVGILAKRRTKIDKTLVFLSGKQHHQQLKNHQGRYNKFHDVKNDDENEHI